MAERREGNVRRASATTRRTEWRAVPVDDRPLVDPLGWVGWLVGGEMIIVGLVALARAGFSDFDLFEPVVAVGPYHLTRLFALITLVLGAIIWGGTAGTPDDLGLRVVGALMLVMGIVWIIEPGGFQQWLGTDTADGLHYAVLGLVLIVFSLIQPFHVGRPPRDAD
jgi:hypothetical protein